VRGGPEAVAGVAGGQWPADWDERMAGRDCPMCAALGHGDNDYWVHVFTGEFAEVNLERRTLLPGYCLVVWRHQHVAEPTDLSPAQASGYGQEVLAAGRAVRSEFGPVKVNYMTLGNRIPHLHTHVVPRYLDDPAPGGPIEWAQMFTPDPVPEAELQRQAARLRLLLAGGPARRP
jgi:diadenosine tetraphosphate (Ap4A) HIT family hydrolase